MLTTHATLSSSEDADVLPLDGAHYRKQGHIRQGKYICRYQQMYFKIYSSVSETDEYKLHSLV
jgi:hypothetical protein